LVTGAVEVQAFETYFPNVGSAITEFDSFDANAAGNTTAGFTASLL
jgi:hypothetical protein